MRLNAWLILSLSLAAGAAQAADKKPATPAPADQLLDFMADWQADDGQWTDPMTFARIDPAKLKADDARRHGKPVPAAVSKPAPAAGTAAR
ncbi:MAG TPA: hypothetical protein VGM16_00795 [Gammaproteobacteria bacterium]|jgi:hypothetical protein